MAKFKIIENPYENMDDELVASNNNKMYPIGYIKVIRKSRFVHLYGDKRVYKIVKLNRRFCTIIRHDGCQDEMTPSELARYLRGDSI